MTGTLPFTAPYLLAPMEGVTEPCFRDLVLTCNEPGALGGAFTEFVRVSVSPIPRAVIARHLGPARFAQPVGVQLMGADLGFLARTAQNAVAAGAPLVDLNFGCPSKGALAGCAGSSLLRDPLALEKVVRAVADAVDVPVTAKIRAGWDDASRIEELARAAENGGATLLTVHCRTRAEGYCDEVDWRRIARAVRAVSIPVCGNGGIARHADLVRMRAETGAALAMVGRAALADPWVFSGREVSRAEAARFLLDYADAMRERGGLEPRGVAARLKQLLRHWTAGGLVPDRATRGELLREGCPGSLLARLAAFAAAFWLALAPAAADAAEHVIQISVDGLSGILLEGLIQADATGQLAGFRRFVDEGATTFNARSDYDYTVTLPNHATMLTGRPVAGPDGHGYTDNGDPAPGVTLHDSGNPAVPYKASSFDVAHDHGRSTALYASKSKFVLFEWSYPDKIDRYVNTSAAAMHQTLLADLAASRWGYAFVHYSSPDDAGHAYGWGSAQWSAAVGSVDDMLESLFAAIQADAELRGRTLVILSADHGGTGTGHSDAANPANYTIPFLAWGDGVAAGADLYALNAGGRLDPGGGRPGYTAAIQPIRNGEGANLALGALGLPPVPGSSIGAAQDLRLAPAAQIPIFPPLAARAVGARP